MHHHLLPVLAFASTVLAQSVVVPQANATALGSSQLNTIVRNALNPRSYQCGMNAAELAGIPIGSVITGVSLRFMVFTTNSPSWPPADIVWNNYDIFVGPAIPTANWTGVTATNFASPPVQVRSGPMTLDASAFTNLGVASVPNPWSEFYFDFQVPYLYLGGDLAFLFSHPGSTDLAIAQYPEAVASDPTTHGVARLQYAYPAGSASTPADFYVMRVHYGYGVPCPGTGGRTPVLVQNANTNGGNGGDIRLQINNAPPGAFVVFALGFQQLAVPFGNCTLYTSPDVMLNDFANSKGRAVLDIVVPPAVIGSFFAQGGVLDAGAPDGLSMTNCVSPAAN